MVEEAVSLCSHFEKSSRSDAYKRLAREGLRTMDGAKESVLSALRGLQRPAPGAASFAQLESALDGLFASLQVRIRCAVSLVFEFSLF